MSFCWNEVIACFGGTFDPPHLGHRQAIQGLFRFPGVGRVVILPAASPPHKPCVASSAQRAELARLCFLSSQPANATQISLDLREIQRFDRNPNRPSYTFDTLTELRQEVQQLAFVIGTDQLCQLHHWYRFPEVLGLSHWIVLDRQGSSTHDIAQKTLVDWETSGLIQKTVAKSMNSEMEWKITSTGKTLAWVRTEAPALSSTEIRRQIARTGQASPDNLSPEVESYLKQHGIYGSSHGAVSKTKE